MCYYYCTTRLTALFSRSTWLSRYQKCETNLEWILLKQETVSGSGISWVVCKSACRYRQKKQYIKKHTAYSAWTRLGARKCIWPVKIE